MENSKASLLFIMFLLLLLLHIISIMIITFILIISNQCFFINSTINTTEITSDIDWNLLGGAVCKQNSWYKIKMNLLILILLLIYLIFFPVFFPVMWFPYIPGEWPFSLVYFAYCLEFSYHVLLTLKYFSISYYK